MENVKKVVANNLVKLRKQNKLTQLELAEKINYSDKAVSRWENGEVTPDIETLNKISEIYNISLAKIFDPDLDVEQEHKDSVSDNRNKIVITLLAISTVWILVISIYVMCLISLETNPWELFIIALPLTCIVGIVFNSLWGIRKINFILISCLVWTLLLSIYIHFLEKNIWPIFILGPPAQIIIILWSNLKKSKRKLLKEKEF